MLAELDADAVFLRPFLADRKGALSGRAVSVRDELERSAAQPTRASAVTARR